MLDRIHLESVGKGENKFSTMQKVLATFYLNYFLIHIDPNLYHTVSIKKTFRISIKLTITQQ